MSTRADLPDVIPVFPLSGALLLPRSRLPLHLFEPRYLAMFDDALKTRHRLIGMIQPMPRPDGQKGALHEIGCAGRITQFSETEDGRYMITLTGISRFRKRDIKEGFTPYLQADVTWDGFERDRDPNPEEDGQFDRSAFLDLLGRYFAAQDLATDWDSLKEAEDEMLINALSMLCPFAPEDKQALLEAPRLDSRRETLMTLIEFAMRGGNDPEEMPRQ